MNYVWQYSDEGVLDTIFEEEANIPKEDIIIATLDSILDIKSVVIPE